MSLKERIERGPERRQPSENIAPLVERRDKPVWLRRMESGQLPPKDTTGTVAA